MGNSCKRAKQKSDSDTETPAVILGTDLDHSHSRGSDKELDRLRVAWLSPEELWLWVAVFIIQTFSSLSDWGITSGAKG